MISGTALATNVANRLIDYRSIISYSGHFYLHVFIFSTFSTFPNVWRSPNYPSRSTIPNLGLKDCVTSRLATRLRWIHLRIPSRSTALNAEEPRDIIGVRIAHVQPLQP